MTDDALLEKLNQHGVELSVVISWMQVQHADRLCARKDLTATQRAFCERSLERAQRRYQSA